MSEIRANTISDAAGTGPVTLTGQYAAKAWVNFNGTGTVAIRESGNVSSITDNTTGDYAVNFTTAMPDASYSISCMGRDFASSSNFSVRFANYKSGSIATGSFSVVVGYIDTDGTVVAEDMDPVFASVIR